MDQSARNYVPDATIVGGVPCEYLVAGCMDANAANYDSTANAETGIIDQAFLTTNDQGLRFVKTRERSGRTHHL